MRQLTGTMHSFENKMDVDPPDQSSGKWSQSTEQKYRGNTMNLKEAIQSRHSVRQYKPDPIPADLAVALEKVIDECNEESGRRL